MSFEKLRNRNQYSFFLSELDEIWYLEISTQFHTACKIWGQSEVIWGQRPKFLGSYHLLMLLILWQHTKVSKTTKQNVAYLFATRGVYEWGQNYGCISIVNLTFLNLEHFVCYYCVYIEPSACSILSSHQSKKWA